MSRTVAEVSLSAGRGNLAEIDRHQPQDGPHRSHGAVGRRKKQGLFGSATYVKAHFADPGTMKTTAEHDALSSYFNIDNGTDASAAFTCRAMKWRGRFSNSGSPR